MRWIVLISLAAVGVIADAGSVHARRGFVLIGSGDTISRRAALGDDLVAEAQQEFGFAEPALGYRYEYFSVFFLDLATFEGEYVLFDEEGDSYVPLTEDDLLDLGTSADELGKPFFYYVPYGWPILLLLGGLWIYAKVREMKTRTW